ncbi:hypothetical protein KKA39_02475, partial [Patescibacteria group bacterium]|nr:hypothetical protein [Patescibacteria group bacterium]
ANFTSFEKGVKIMLDNINDWKIAPLWNKKSIKKASAIAGAFYFVIVDASRRTSCLLGYKYPG